MGGSPKKKTNPTGNPTEKRKAQAPSSSTASKPAPSLPSKHRSFNEKAERGSKVDDLPTEEEANQHVINVVEPVSAVDEQDKVAREDVAATKEEAAEAAAKEEVAEVAEAATNEEATEAATKEETTEAAAEEEVAEAAAKEEVAEAVAKEEVAEVEANSKEVVQALMADVIAAVVEEAEKEKVIVEATTANASKVRLISPNQAPTSNPSPRLDLSLEPVATRAGYSRALLRSSRRGSPTRPYPPARRPPPRPSQRQRPCLRRLCA